METVNPCLHCGACCAFFRVSFYYREADDIASGGVPLELTEDFNQFRRMMKGTDKPDPRCIALEGQIGNLVRCMIYPLRSSTCRDFTPSWVDGLPNPDCDRARAHYGLHPLKKEDWGKVVDGEGPFPRAA